jgi:Ca2+-binding RTX toxin-like protein
LRRVGDESDNLAGVVISAGIAPTLTLGFGFPVVEDRGLSLAASTAQFGDSDSPSLGGGALVVTLASPKATDRIGLVVTGPDISVSGGDVSYQGMTIGTLSGGGFGGGSLTISFNANATPGAVQALIRAVGLESVEQNGPFSDSRSLTFEVSDGSGGSVQANTNVVLFATDDAPVIANLAGDQAAAVAAGGAVRLDQGIAAAVTDIDNVNFNTGSLVVRMTQNRTLGEDLFGLAAGSGVSMAAGFVFVNGTTVGTVEPVNVGSDLVIRFNNVATPAAVAQIIGAVTYANTNGFNPSLLLREVSFILKSGAFTTQGEDNTATVTTQISVTAPSGPPPPPPPPPEGPRSITVASPSPNDSVLSGDGLRLYTASSDGFVRIYSAETGALIQTIDVGDELGALDVSLDGRWLAVTERHIVSTSPPGTPINDIVTVIAMHRVDLVTGAVTTHTYEVHGSTATFGDLSYLSNGKVLLAAEIMALFDPATGAFTSLNVPGAGALQRSAEGDRVLIGSTSTMPGSIYDQVLGSLYRDTSGLFPALEIAYSGETGLTAISTHGGGILIYDAELHLKTQLTQYNPQWAASIHGLAFDETGASLFALEIGQNVIVQLSTADWSIVNTIPLLFDLTGARDLQIGPDLRYFTFLGDNGLMRINNPLVADAVQGTLAADNLTGTGANDFLIGDTGADTMTGGAGNDIYYVDQDGDVVVEAVGGGSDVVRASASYALGAGAEVERLEAASRYGTQALNLTGNEFANHLRGNSGVNVLIGGGGADTLSGGKSSDFYRVEEAGDIVVEAVGEGSDAVYAVTSYALSAGSEVELLSAIDPGSTVGMNLTGNEFANLVIGTAGSNTMIGGGGADTLIGGAGNDVYRVEEAGDVVVENANGGFDAIYAVGSYTLAAGSEIELLSAIAPAVAAAMNLTGNEYANLIIGNAAGNTLIGGGGADTLIGGAGNDFYRVEEAGDIVIEGSGGGFDSVYAVGSYALAAGSEVELLSAIDPASTAGMNLTGNEYANLIYGNAAANTLIGGGGADVLIGGAGGDFYRVEEAGDVVVEAVGGGADSVYAVGSYTLAAGSEVELLSAIDPGATTAMDLTGNEFANSIYGNAGSNTLIGGGGADTLLGGGGNDYYRVEEAGDAVVEAVGGGTDAVYAVASYTLAAGTEVEILSAIDPGSTGGMNLTGNEYGNFIYGTAGANTLSGGLGHDALWGFGGADNFLFNTTPSGSNWDTIADFVSGTDKILLDHNVFVGIGPLGALGSGAFSDSGANTPEARILYAPGLGWLSYDADGSGPGAAVLFASLMPGDAVTQLDFVVV